MDIQPFRLAEWNRRVHVRRGTTKHKCHNLPCAENCIFIMQNRVDADNSAASLMVLSILHKVLLIRHHDDSRIHSLQLKNLSNTGGASGLAAWWLNIELELLRTRSDSSGGWTGRQGGAGHASEPRQFGHFPLKLSHILPTSCLPRPGLLAADELSQNRRDTSRNVFELLLTVGARESASWSSANAGLAMLSSCFPHPVLVMSASQKKS